MAEVAAAMIAAAATPTQFIEVARNKRKCIDGFSSFFQKMAAGKMTERNRFTKRLPYCDFGASLGIFLFSWVFFLLQIIEIFV